MARHWAVRVVSIEGGHVALELRTLHDEAGPPDVTTAFALNLVVEHWWRFVRQLDVTRDFEENIVAFHSHPDGPPWDPRIERVYEASFGREIEVTRKDFERARREHTLNGRRVTSSGTTGPRSAPQYRVHLEGDREAFEQLAAKSVHDLVARDRVNEGAYERWPERPAEGKDRGEYESACPRVTLEFTLDPPGLASFLRVGMEWETTAYR